VIDFFDVFGYYPYNLKWCCIRCIEDAKAAKQQGELERQMGSTPQVVQNSPQVAQNSPQTMQPTTIQATNNATPSPNQNTPSEKEMSGVLKRKTDYLRQMKSRFFLLNTQGLTYWKQKGDPKPLKQIALVDILNVKDGDTRVTHHDFSFYLVTKKKTVLLCAANEEEKQKWITSFRQAIKEW